MSADIEPGEWVQVWGQVVSTEDCHLDDVVVEFFSHNEQWRGPIQSAAKALRAALADESAQDGLSRAGTTSVASGATGDTEGAQMGAEGIEGDEG